MQAFTIPVPSGWYRALPWICVLPCQKTTTCVDSLAGFSPQAQSWFSSMEVSQMPTEGTYPWPWLHSFNLPCSKYCVCVAYSLNQALGIFPTGFMYRFYLSTPTFLRAECRNAKTIMPNGLRGTVSRSAGEAGAELAFPTDGRHDKNQLQLQLQLYWFFEIG